MWIATLRERMRASLWVTPAVCVLLAGLAAILLPWIDERLGGDRPDWLLFGGSAESARSVLSTTASSMLTLTALVFSVTMVVLQLASGQFSPRVLRTFLRDRVPKLTLGVFIGTFTYALLVLRTLRADSETADAFVPAVSVSGAIVLSLVSVGFFMKYIDHIAQAIRVSSVIRSVAGETKDAMRRIYPEAVGEPDPEPKLPVTPPDRDVVAPTAGVVTGVDPDALMRVASAESLSIEIVPFIGDFVPVGSRLARVWGSCEDEVASRISRCVHLGPDRTMRQDVAYGFRQLVDIAERALSPGINDPTTAVQVIDALHDLLRTLAGRSLPQTERRSPDGRGAVFARTPDWTDYLSLAVDEIREYGSESLQVQRRLRAMLEDVLEASPPHRGVAVAAHLELLDETASRMRASEHVRSRATEPSNQGNL